VAHLREKKKCIEWLKLTVHLLITDGKERRKKLCQENLV